MPVTWTAESFEAANVALANAIASIENGRRGCLKQFFRNILIAGMFMAQRGLAARR